MYLILLHQYKHLNRWGTGEPISLSLALQLHLSWDFYRPSGTRCLTLQSPRRRRQEKALVECPIPVLVTLGLSPPISPISPFPFLSTWLSSNWSKWFYRGCLRPNALSTESAEGLLARVFQNGFSIKTKRAIVATGIFKILVFSIVASLRYFYTKSLLHVPL